MMIRFTVDFVDFLAICLFLSCTLAMEGFSPNNAGNGDFLRNSQISALSFSAFQTTVFEGFRQGKAAKNLKMCQKHEKQHSKQPKWIEKLLPRQENLRISPPYLDRESLELEIQNEESRLEKLVAERVEQEKKIPKWKKILFRNPKDAVRSAWNQAFHTQYAFYDLKTDLIARDPVLVPNNHSIGSPANVDLLDQDRLVEIGAGEIRAMKAVPQTDPLNIPFLGDQHTDEENPQSKSSTVSSEQGDRGATPSKRKWNVQPELQNSMLSPDATESVRTSGLLSSDSGPDRKPSASDAETPPTARGWPKTGDDSGGAVRHRENATSDSTSRKSDTNDQVTWRQPAPGGADGGARRIRSGQQAEGLWRVVDRGGLVVRAAAWDAGDVIGAAKYGDVLDVVGRSDAADGGEWLRLREAWEWRRDAQAWRRAREAWVRARGGNESAAAIRMETCEAAEVGRRGRGLWKVGPGGVRVMDRPDAGGREVRGGRRALSLRRGSLGGVAPVCQGPAAGSLVWRARSNKYPGRKFLSAISPCLPGRQSRRGMSPGHTIGAIGDGCCWVRHLGGGHCEGAIRGAGGAARCARAGPGGPLRGGRLPLGLPIRRQRLPRSLGPRCDGREWLRRGAQRGP